MSEKTELFRAELNNITTAKNAKILLLEVLAYAEELERSVSVGGINTAQPEEWDEVHRATLGEREEVSRVIQHALTTADTVGHDVYVVKDSLNRLRVETGARYRAEAIEIVQPQGGQHA